MARKAVFLDRDGVINEDTGYVHTKEEFRFVSGIFDALRQLEAMGYLIIIVTNQAGIARGYYTESDFLNLTAWMTDIFLERDIHITKTYFCPYHPTHGLGKYKVDSEMRKPNPGMILLGQREYDLDLEESIMIGDHISDVEAGLAAGIGINFLLSNVVEEEQVPMGVIRISDIQDIPLVVSAIIT